MTDSRPALPRTKIVATVGPSCREPAMLRRLAEEGVSVFRINFSHGTHEEHAAVIVHLRELPAKLGRPLAILGDLSGPKLRIGPVPNNGVSLEPGDLVRLTSHANVSEERRYSVNIPDFHKLIAPGRPVLLDDGLVRLEAKKIDGEDVVCRVTNKCVLRSRKGINLPGTYLPIPAMTEKDERDLAFAIEHKLDYVALSFVRDPADIDHARAAMDRLGRRVPLIAKIEKGEAVEALDEILDKADGAMVARGDLGVEIPVEHVPSVQRRILQSCNDRAKPVITATQMLNSMIENPVPTRAEVTDIYNAIHQGTDAVMLSGETASGAWPLESVATMRRVAHEAEADLDWAQTTRWRQSPTTTESISQAVTRAAIGMARDLELDAIVCATMGGTTARRLSRFRPACPILAFSSLPDSVNQLVLHWGVEPRLQRNLWASEIEAGESAAIIENSLQTARQEGILTVGQRIVMVAGLPIGSPGVTNFLRVVEIQEGALPT